MKLVLATNNQGKAAEFQRIFEPLGIEILTQKQVGVQIAVEETGTTFAQNAKLKAMAVYQLCGLPTVADDSGLCIDAMDGKPGVYSARWYGEDTPYSEKNRRILEELRDIPKEKRGAQFIAHITCVFSSEDILECEGVCEGIIGPEPRGEGGFGYDPIFYVGEKSFAQLTAQEKDEVSHRGKALRELYEQMKRRNQKEN